MATGRKPTIATLTKLGARKLAELLLAEAADNRQLKQALNLAISAKEGPVALGATLRNMDARRTSGWRNSVWMMIGTPSALGNTLLIGPSGEGRGIQADAD